MSDLFYRAFEEKYRGSRELIKTRLQVYLPFVQPLLKTYPQGKALDVGCGRGEWLEILGELGFDALGVDLDDGMLQACRDANLNVETADAVSYMKELPESSVCIVSGFHIAEHLPFAVLQQLVHEALRVLVPGGLLILETPNPENIAVGTSSFYLDPTHNRPIPPELLGFLPEHYGFARFKVMRLQESAHLHGDSRIGLLDVLGGVSPDFAVVAQKQGVPLLMEELAPAFDKDYGLTLHHLANRYQHAVDKMLIAIEAKAQQVQEQAQQAESKAQQAESKAQQAESKAQQAESKAQQAETKAQQLNEQWVEVRDESTQVRAQMNQSLDLLQTAQTQMQQAFDRAEKAESVSEQLQQKLLSTTEDLLAVRQELHDVHQSNHHHFSQLEQTRKELHDVHQANHHHWLQVQERDQLLAALQASKSWRITAPLRWVVYRARWLKTGLAAWFTFKPGSRPRRTLRSAIVFLRNWIVARPHFARVVGSLINRFPGVKARLLGISEAEFIADRFANYPKNRDQGSFYREGISEEGSVLMSFVGAEFGQVTRLPDYISNWWGLQQCGQNVERIQDCESDRIETSCDISGTRRLKILQMTTYNVDKPDHGGKLRCHHIRRSLRTRFDVKTLSFEWGECENTKNKSVILDQRKWSSLGIDGVTSDWGINTYLSEDATCYHQVANLVREYSPDVIMIEQPFLWPLVERFMMDGTTRKDIKLIYSSHNVEINMKRVIYQDCYDSDLAIKYASYVDEIEKGVIRACTAAIAVSANDATYVEDVSPHKSVRVYSNGHTKLSSTSEDEKWRRLFAHKDRNWVFVGSWHPPNVNGLRDLVAALKLLGDEVEHIALWVLGGAGTGFLNEDVDFRQADYPWLHILGPASGEDIESAIMCSSGVVLPIWEGGGSNLKTAQALLSGKCVLGSEFSFRGFEHCTKEDGVSLTVDAVGLAKLVVNTNPQQHYSRSESVGALAWETILEPLPSFIQDVVGQDD